MSEPAAPATADAAAPPTKPVKKEENFLVFLLKVGLIVAIFRSFIFSPFNIPSESMLPRLLDGDYLLAAKWPYGVSSYSLPFSVPLIPGRLFASQPKRGDIAIFKAPADLGQDWIKRVIGLPGDTIQVKAGVLFINGTAVPRVRVEDFIHPVTPNMIEEANTYHRLPCNNPAFEMTLPDGTPACRYPQYRETLPEGKSYNIIQMGDKRDIGSIDPENTQPYIVPEGALFMMGDDRDNSDDSRFSVAQGGVGMLPQANLVGRATVMMWSTDGSASWFKPWTWFTAARWSRIGGTF